MHSHRSLVSACYTEQTSRADPKTLTLHPAAVPHWREDALVRQPAVGEQSHLAGIKPDWILRTIMEEKITIVGSGALAQDILMPSNGAMKLEDTTFQ